MGLKTISDIPDINSEFRQLKRRIPPIVANIAKRHFLEGFRRDGGQTDDSRSGWRERKKQDKNRTRRGILIKSGQLRNDVDVRKTTFEEIVIGTSDTAYGIVHNEGSKSMPKREFLGDSMVMNMKIIKKIDQLIKKALK